MSGSVVFEIRLSVGPRSATQEIYQNIIKIKSHADRETDSQREKQTDREIQKDSDIERQRQRGKRQHLLYYLTGGGLVSYTPAPLPVKNLLCEQIYIIYKKRYISSL